MKWPWKHTKEYPEFWNTYVNAFAKANPKSLTESRFVSFDTETTGLDVKNDKILSIGAVALQQNTISVMDSFELYIKQEQYNPESAPIHGILKHGEYKKVNEIDAIKRCLDFIGTDILVGHHVGFDLAIINNTLKRYGLGKLKNKALDTGTLYKRLLHPVNYALIKNVYTLDELSEALKIPVYDRHTASGDAMITALAFIKICTRLNSHGKLKLKDLFK